MNQNYKEKFDEIYFNSLEKTKISSEYIDNSQKIDLYKKLLTNNYNVPTEKLEEFIDLIHEQLELEYENAINDFINNINNKRKS